MKVSAVLMITAASAALAAPVPEAAPNPQANYGDYKYTAYGDYGTYDGVAPAPAPAPPSSAPPVSVPPASLPSAYGSYSPYGSYGTYKRAVDWIKSLFQ